jgi:3-deoxy-manno-octulosonate cytidylyltransferase (CMP-KDO synthetase)
MYDGAVHEADERTFSCSLCGMRQDQVAKLFPGPGVLVCDQCLRVARDLFGDSAKHDVAAPPLRPVAVIPARYGSTRFPGKPLAPIAGKPMVQHVFERCLESGVFGQVMVATDDLRIAAAVQAFGGKAILTSKDCQSGTDRVAELARSIERWLSPEEAAAASYDRLVFVNVQADEPAIHPEALRVLAGAFDDPKVEMATLVRPLIEPERKNPDVVKAVLGLDGNALYFSRADLPHCRHSDPLSRWAHVGIYGYRWTTLLTIAALPKSPLEQTEGLEQLRALENGIRIACRVTEHSSVSVARPEDVSGAEALLLASSQKVR